MAEDTTGSSWWSPRCWSASVAGLVNGVLIAYGKVVAVHRDPGDARRAPAGWPRSSPTGAPRSSRTSDFLDFFSGDVLGIPMLVIIFALVAVAGWVLLNRTTFGRRTFAVGGNPEAARLAGIKVKRHTVCSTCCPGCAAASPR